MNQELKTIEIEKLDFDSKNPRFFAEGLSEEQLLKKMLDEEDVIELIQSIAQNGYFAAEPLLVVEENGKHIVAEGNRRLAALKLLLNPSKATTKTKAVQLATSDPNAKTPPTKVPCLVFPDRKHILEYLGFRHITGAKPWGPLAKAQYLKELQKHLDPGLDFSTQCGVLSKTIGSNAATVRNLLTSFALYDLIESKLFFNIDGLGRDTFEFGVFYTALKTKDVSEYIGSPKSDEEVSVVTKLSELEDLTKWLFEKTEDPVTGKKTTRIGESRNISKLCRVLRNANALKAFKDDGLTLQRASEMAGELIELFETDCRNALELTKIASNRVSSLRDALDNSHQRLSGELQYEATELHDKIRKQVKINES